MIEFESTLEQPRAALCVVYDQRDGRVVHLHEFIGDATGIFAPDADEERAHMALASAQRHRESEHLRVMHAPPDFRLEPEVLYRVDLGSRKLVTVSGAGQSLRELIERRRTRRPKTT